MGNDDPFIMLLPHLFHDLIAFVIELFFTIYAKLNYIFMIFINH